MFINIDYNKRPKEAKLHLAKPNKRVISNIYEKFNDSLSVKLGNINELNFSIPHFIYDEASGSNVKNQHVDLIKEKMLIRVTLGAYKEWYIVDEISEDADAEDVFNVKAFSLGYELKGKRISGLTEDSINATGILTSILETSVWKIGKVDPIFDKMYRSFESSEDSNALDCIMNAGETFGALIEWDTAGRKISFKDATKVGIFKGMSVSYGKFLRSLKRTRTTDEMVTRMYVYGNENLSIYSYNPTGQPYIEDFSFFMFPFEQDTDGNVLKSSDFMSDELCIAINNHKALVAVNAPDIKLLTDLLFSKQISLIEQQSILDTFELELNNILELLDVAKSAENEVAIAQKTSEKIAKEAQIKTQEDIVQDLVDEVEGIEREISIKHSNISSQANFTPELLDELNLYIIESTWRDDRYIDAKELYDDGVKKFEELRQPKVVIEVSIDNLLNIVEEQHYWDKLNLGDLIKVKYEEMNIEYMAKIIEINYDLENGEISLVIANTKDLLSDSDKLVQLLYSNTSASTILQNNKYKWDKINAIEGKVSSLLTDEWDATKKKIIAGVRNSVEVGNRGIIIRNPDFPDEIVIMQSGVIALSKDNGDTWSTAIKPDGIVAERLIGQIIAGQELLITNSSGTFSFDNNGVFIDASAFVVRSGTGRNIVTDWTDSASFISEFRDDGIITSYEKSILRNQWSKIDGRYANNIERINGYYEDGGESLQWVANYKSAHLALYNYLFVTLHGDKPLLEDGNIVFSTRIDKAIYDSKFANYDSSELVVDKELALRAKELTQQALDGVSHAQERIDEVESDVVYKTELLSTNGDTFTNGNINTTVYVVVYRGKDNITATLPASAFIWKKVDADGTIDTAWNNKHVGVGHTIQIDENDVYKRATFWCDIYIPEQ